MNRYIRTKEGEIFDLENKKVSSWEYIDNDTAVNEYGVEGAFYTIYYFDENEGHYSEYDGKGGHSCDFIEEKDIIKQADTIEELCDEFVAIHPTDENANYITDDAPLEILYEMEYKKFHRIIYGAIWTDKGLIYVAKLNDKGDLELI